LYGKGIVEFVKQTGKVVNGNSVLDYGCGPGFLIKFLLNEPVNCYGFDYSAVSVNEVNKKFSGCLNWQGAHSAQNLPLPFKDNQFDIVTCLETLEHFNDDTLVNALSEIYRVLAIDGLAVFTTPYNEDLTLNYIRCPFCNAEYHKVQHIRSFTKEGLSELLESKGFSVMFCDTVNFDDFQMQPFNILDVSLRWVRKVIGNNYRMLVDNLFGTQFPNTRLVSLYRGGKGHLCAVAKKNGDLI
jgi:ubiquinone/menaquinone biosynthesis C-methylase UbiE